LCVNRPLYPLQVLVTVNVVIKEAELESLIETLSALEALEVDAVIVQVRLGHASR
jgi:collagenase-like PrtC family protease